MDILLRVKDLKVSSSGIHGHSFWGMRHFLNWTEIIQVRRFKLGNLVYLRLYSGVDSRVIWFPLFQSPPIGFREEIRKFAPPNCPILNHLN